MRPSLRQLTAVIVTALAVACGTSPSGPTPQPAPPSGGVTPPANNPPVVQSITIQGSRPRQPSNFAEVGEVLQVTASVRDDETAPTQLQYNWSSAVGTFAGTGESVTWQAPSQVTSPTAVVLNLQVVERYGTAPNVFEHRVTATASLSLHDSIKEVGDMAKQFLLDFSDSSLRNVDYIMRNFGNATTCPDVREVESERYDVEKDRAQFQIVNSRIGTPRVSVNFGGSCPFRFKRGDACAVVPSYWDSIKLDTKQRGAVDGDDILAAAYSTAGSRWWLCSSDYDGRQVSGATLSGFRSMR